MSIKLTHQISLAEAVALTGYYRADPVTNLPICETFEKDSVLALLNQAGTRFLRIYQGRKPDNLLCAVLVAANDLGQDILPSATGSSLAAADDEGIILEDAFHCPPACPPPSPLNG